MKCLRCGETLAFYGEVRYLTQSTTSLGMLANAHPLMIANVFVCPQCGHMENFATPDQLAQNRASHEGDKG